MTGDTRPSTLAGLLECGAGRRPNRLVPCPSVRRVKSNHKLNDLQSNY